MRGDRILNIASVTLRMANCLNWAFVAGFIVALLMSFVFVDALATQLASKYHGRNVAETIATMRALALLGIPAGFAVHQIFTRLHAIVATVLAGDPFVAANADRLQRIGLGATRAAIARLGARRNRRRI